MTTYTTKFKWFGSCTAKIVCTHCLSEFCIQYNTVSCLLALYKPEVRALFSSFQAIIVAHLNVNRMNKTSKGNSNDLRIFPKTFSKITLMVYYYPQTSAWTVTAFKSLLKLCKKYVRCMYVRHRYVFSTAEEKDSSCLKTNRWRNDKQQSYLLNGWILCSVIREINAG